MTVWLDMRVWALFCAIGSPADWYETRYRFDDLPYPLASDQGNSSITTGHFVILGDSMSCRHHVPSTNRHVKTLKYKRFKVKRHRGMRIALGLSRPD